MENAHSNKLRNREAIYLPLPSILRLTSKIKVSTILSPQLSIISHILERRYWAFFATE